MKKMVYFKSTIYQNIIKENRDKVAKMILENVVQGIGEVEGHDLKLIVSIMRSKRYLLNIRGSYKDLVVP